jgi:hypothetical protein
MTREAFIKVLEEKDYSYRIEGNKVIVTHKGNVDLRDLTSLPPGVVFKNEAVVNLNSITSLPPGVEFKHRGNVYFKSLMGGRFSDWRGDIEGIDSKRLLNLMISKGLFL